MASPSQFDPPGLSSSPSGSSDAPSALSRSGGSDWSTGALLTLMDQDPNLAGYAARFRRSATSSPQSQPPALPASSSEVELPHNLLASSSPLPSSSNLVASSSAARNVTSLAQLLADPNFALEGSSSPSEDSSAFSSTAFSSSAFSSPAFSSPWLSSASSPTDRSASASPSSSSSSSLLDLVSSSLHALPIGSEQEDAAEEDVTPFADEQNAFLEAEMGHPNLAITAVDAAEEPPSAMVRARLAFPHINATELFPTDSNSNPFLRFPSHTSSASSSAATTSPTKAYANATPYTPSSTSKVNSHEKRAQSGNPHFSAPASLPISRPPPTSPTKPTHYNNIGSVNSGPPSVNLALAPLRSAPSAPQSVFGLAAMAKQQSMTYASAAHSARLATPYEAAPGLVIARPRNLASTSVDISLGKDYLAQGNPTITCGMATGLVVMTTQSTTLETALLQIKPIIEEVIRDLLVDIPRVVRKQSGGKAGSGGAHGPKTAVEEDLSPEAYYGVVSRVERCRMHFFIVILDPVRIPILPLFERVILHPGISLLPTISRIYPVTAAFHPDVDFTQGCINGLMEYCQTRGLSLDGDPGTLMIGLAIEAHHASKFAAELKVAMSHYLPAVHLVEKNPTECPAMLTVCYFNTVFLMSVWEPINPNNLNNFRPAEMERWSRLHPNYVPRTPVSALRTPPDLRPRSLSRLEPVREILVDTIHDVPFFPSTFGSSNFAAAPSNTHVDTRLYSSSVLPAPANLNASVARGASPYGAIGSSSSSAPYASAPAGHHAAPSSALSRTTTAITRPHAPAPAAKASGSLLNTNVNIATATRAHSLSGAQQATHASGAPKGPKNVPGGKRRPNGRH